MKTAILSMLMMLSTMTLRASDKTPFDLTTLLGETYHNCRIIKVTPAALTVVYDNGVSKVPFDLLGDAWRELYHYDPDKAQKYTEQEQEKRREAEARAQELKHNVELSRNQQMTELIKAENQKEELEKKLAKEQADAAANRDAAKTAPEPPPAPPPSPQLAPFPGDAVLPPTPPISNIYTPGQPTTGTNPSNPPTVDPSGGFPFIYTPGYGFPPTSFGQKPPPRRMHRLPFPSPGRAPQQ